MSKRNQKRKQAFRLRVERKPLTDVARAVGVSVRTVSRWENGWADNRGKQHAGWKGELEKAWKEIVESELDYGLMLKEERIKAYEELARMSIAKLKEIFPHIGGKTAADAKALLSEVRELCKLIREERDGVGRGPQTIVAVKTDISLGELQERYHAAHSKPVIGVAVVEGGTPHDADCDEGDAGPGPDAEVAGDQPGISPGAD